MSSLSEHVFPQPSGLPGPYEHFDAHWYAALEVAGISDFHFHDLRHTAATLLLSRGVHPKVVSEMLGHADISITLRVYAHVTPNMQEAAVQVMDGLFGLTRSDR